MRIFRLPLIVFALVALSFAAMAQDKASIALSGVGVTPRLLTEFGLRQPRHPDRHRT